MFIFLCELEINAIIFNADMTIIICKILFKSVIWKRTYLNGIYMTFYFIIKY